MKEWEGYHLWTVSLVAGIYSIEERVMLHGQIDKPAYMEQVKVQLTAIETAIRRALDVPMEYDK